MTYKISIITPSFNSVQFVQRAIESVLNQDDPNFEHIIIDACSTDGTLDLCRKYNHLILVSEPDKGQSDAMNKGFLLSKGEIIVYLNADDFFLPGAFSEIRKAFLNDNPDIVVGDLLINQAGKDRVNQSEWRYSKLIHPNFFGFPYNPVSYFYKRNVQERVGLFPINEQFVMDYWFIIRAFKNARVKKINFTLGCFYIHENCKTHSVVDSNLMLVKTVAAFFEKDSFIQKIIYAVHEFQYRCLKFFRLL